MIFFTADHHFYHNSIMAACNRPFDDVEQMNSSLIYRWNHIVRHDDTVFHLGDFTLRGKDAAKYLFSMLNGAIVVIADKQHHDKKWLPKLGEFGFIDMKSKTNHPVKLLPPIYVHQHHELPPIVMCHFPMASWNRKHYGSWHLHAHSHGNHHGEGFIMDVGVDCTSLAPISLDDIEKYMKKRIQNE